MTTAGEGHNLAMNFVHIEAAKQELNKVRPMLMNSVQHETVMKDPDEYEEFLDQEPCYNCSGHGAIEEHPDNPPIKCTMCGGTGWNSIE